MEVAIVAGVALAGWYLNSPAAPAPPKPAFVPVSTGGGTPIETRPDQATEDLLRYKEGAVKRFTESQFPERSGIIAPFFRDVRSQQTNAAMKQRTMTNFVGNDPTWKPKREQEAIFNPTPQDIDSSGRAGNRPAYDQDLYRNSLTGVQSGTLPFERTNVGRGLGIDPSEAAADNFHPMLRIIPPSGDLHKHHEMSSRVATTGSTYIQEMPLKPAIRVNRPPRVWTQERRPMEKGRATVTGPSHRGDHTSVVPPCHLDTEHRVGVAYREGGMPVNGTMTRQDDRTTTIAGTNVTGPSAAGGYVGANFDPAKFESLDREAPGQILGVKYYNSSITKYMQDAPQDTVRDLTGKRFSGPGNVEPVVKGQQDYCTNLQLLKEAKRGAYVETKHTPGPQNTTAYRQANLGIDAPPYVQTEWKMRSQIDHAPVRVQIDSSASRYASTTDQVGTFASNGKKITGESNSRNDFQLAQRVLADNPYAIRQQ